MPGTQSVHAFENSLGIHDRIDSDTLPTIFETVYHFAVVFDADGNSTNDPSNPGRIELFHNGVSIGQTSTSLQLADLNDVNNWFGRSNYTVDGNLNGALNEIRIYDQPLSPEQIRHSRDQGADIKLGESVVAHSIHEFSGIQGQYGWSSGYRNYSTDGGGPDYDPVGGFIPFNGGSSLVTPFNGESQQWSGECWSLSLVGAPNLSVCRETASPNGSNSTPGEEYWPVRRWKADEITHPMPLALIWNAFMTNVNGGGVRGSLHINGVEVDSRIVPGQDSVGEVRVYYAIINPGDFIDLALSPEGSDGRSDFGDVSETWLRIEDEIPDLPVQPDGKPFLLAGQSFPVDPLGAYLLTDDQDLAIAPLIVNLDELPFEIPERGHLLLRSEGAWRAGIDSEFFSPESSQAGVFSSSNVFLDSSVRKRVSGSLDSGHQLLTGPTYFQNQETDVPDDFGIVSALSPSSFIRVPDGSKYLFVAVPDSLYSDNQNLDLDVIVQPAQISESPLVLNQRTNGHLESVSEWDFWTFSATVGDQVSLDVLGGTSSGVRYSLWGPDGWVGLDQVAESSSLITLPTTGKYSVVVGKPSVLVGVDYVF